MPQPREPDRIQCLVCGKWFRALPKHVRHAHDLDEDDYRLRFAIPVGVPLVCLEWSERQAVANVARDAARTLTARGSPKGIRRRASVKVTSAARFKALAAAGTAAASRQDKTAQRRQRLAPYPVTIQQAADRLDCTPSAAATFLSYCVGHKKLRRLGRGLYGE